MERAFRPTFSTAFVSKRAHGGVGLAGMRERINELGGRMEMDSDSHGTRVVATMPRAEPKKFQPKNLPQIDREGRTLRTRVVSAVFRHQHNVAGSCRRPMTDD